MERALYAPAAEAEELIARMLSGVTPCVPVHVLGTVTPLLEGTSESRGAAPAPRGSASAPWKKGNCQQTKGRGVKRAGSERHSGC